MTESASRQLLIPGTALMTATVDNVRRELTETRLRMDATAAELNNVVSERLESVTQSVDPRHYAREFPWAALGIAFGAGLAIGLSGADRAAAANVVAGAKTTATAIGDGAVSAKDAIVERIHGDWPDDSSDEAAQPPATESAGVRAKLTSALDDLLYDGLQEI